MPVRFRQPIETLPWFPLAVSPNYTNIAMTTANSRVAWQFYPEETGTLTRFLFRASGTAAQPPDYRFRVCADDGAGRPNTASVVETKTWTPPTSLTTTAVELSGWAVSATRGTPLWMVMDYNAGGTIGASNAITIFHTAENGWGPCHYANPGVLDDTTGSSWTVRMGTSTSIPVFAWGTASRTWGSVYSTTPTEALAADGDRMAAKIVWPDRFGGASQVNSIAVPLISSTTATIRLGIWNSSGTALATADVYGGVIATQTNLRIWSRPFATRPTIAAGATIYVGYERVSGYDPLTRHVVVPSNAVLDQYPLGSGCVSSRWASGAWTDITDRLMGVRVYLDEVADAAGGGGGTFLVEG